MSNCCSVALHVDESGGAALTVADSNVMKLGIGGSMYAVPPPLYTGSHDFTPTNEAQVIPIDGLRSVGDIIIEPIPSNYGLITWDGSVITVS